MSLRSPIDLSLMFFAADSNTPTDENPYRLLLDAARFADEHGFSAVWIPERHFHQFGGLYPNPSVIGAALAVTTKRLQIRAGSIVAALHDPLRIAEDWAVVDNLSEGRAAVSFASGWHANDFVFRPEAYDDRRAVMVERIAEVRSLWRGEALQRTSGTGKSVAVRTLPRPRGTIPIWVTAAGDPETFKLAGRLGAGMLTHLLGQTLDEVRDKIMLYREARREAGYGGPGRVALMLHTFVGESDEHAKAQVEAPMRAYLRTSAELMRSLVGDTAEGDGMKETDVDALLERAFQRSFVHNGMFGGVERCAAFLDRVGQVGIDDIACLIDFGVSNAETLAALPRLHEVHRRGLELSRSR